MTAITARSASTRLGRYDVVVVGAGTAGCVVAHRLVRAGRRVLLLESGPDYGPLDATGWPPELLGPSMLPTSHRWTLTSIGESGRTITHGTARVVGGCSSHNHCAVVWGSRRFYDQWAAVTGDPTWGAAAMRPRLQRMASMLHTRPIAPEHRLPLSSAFIDGARAEMTLGGFTHEFCEPGVDYCTFNIDRGVRFNTAFAFLDPIRTTGDVEVWGDAEVERLEIRGGRVREIEVRRGTEAVVVRGETVVLCAGTYHSPALLMRSGVGDPAQLAALDIDVRHGLPQVGHNLRDHPAVTLAWRASGELTDALAQSAAPPWMPGWQTLAKLSSSRATGSFDLHVFPTHAATPDGTLVTAGVSCMTPHSVGELSIVSADPTEPPAIAHHYLQDAGQHDLQVLTEGVAITQRIFDRKPLCRLISAEIAPGLPAHHADDVQDWIRASVGHYFHPVGTCAMGAAGAPDAVTDPQGRVSGLDNLVIADASVLPLLPDANTNLPVAAAADRIAEALVDQLSRGQNIDVSR